MENEDSYFPTSIKTGDALFHYLIKYSHSKFIFKWINYRQSHTIREMNFHENSLIENLMQYDRYDLLDHLFCSLLSFEKEKNLESVIVEVNQLSTRETGVRSVCVFHCQI